MTVPEKQTLDQRSTALNMREIARQLGVSIASVSRALNNQPGVSEEMRQRIHGFVQERAYRLRPSLTSANPTNTPGHAHYRVHCPSSRRNVQARSILSGDFIGFRTGSGEAWLPCAGALNDGC